MEFLSRKRIVYVLAVMFITLGGLLSPAQSQVAEAAPTYGYVWKLEFDFESSFNGMLTVEAGPGQVSGLDKVLVSEQFKVPCRRVGNVALAGGNAEFSGGYLHCELDLASAIKETFDRCEHIESECTYVISPVEEYGGLRMAAKMMSFPGAGITPIFHHPDAAYTIDVGSAHITQLNEINPVPGAISSPLTPIALAPPTMHNYAARYLCDVGPNCKMYYSAAGGVTQVGPYVDLPQMQITPVAFYIGHNADTGAVMPSTTTLDYLFIDPPALGEH